ncbi:MAG: DNA-methyltransferase [Thermoplasmataceae archaeon]
MHPTQKPVWLIRRTIETSCKPEGIIFDPFMGSGTTGVACVQMGRNFIGYELDPDYFKIAEDRIRRTRPDRDDKNKFEIQFKDAIEVL